jgi:purine nucleoside phosphorylase
MRIGIIAGSGAAEILRPAANASSLAIDTRWGQPSAPVLHWRDSGHDLYLLPRHGQPHALAPHEVNYLANVWAFRDLAVDHLIGVNAVGGITDRATPGRVVLPHQLVDYTWGRQHTYVGDGIGLQHVDFTEPFSAPLRQRLQDAAAAAGIEVLEKATYAVTQGPRLETAAEIKRLERDGCDVVGMTAMPEAGLAREAGISYAICCGVVNYAAGCGPGGVPIHDQIDDHMRAAMGLIGLLLGAFLRLLPARHDDE